MSSKINLNSDVWAHRGRTFVRGDAFYNGEYRDAGELAGLVKSKNDIASLSSFLSSLNGFFSVVIDTDEEVIFAADRMRTGPVFYSVVDNELQISDDCGWIIEQTPDPSRSELSEIEYETSRFVTGPYTLYGEISQLQSGEMVVFEKATTSFSTRQLHTHTVTESQYKEADLESEFQRVLDAVFDRLVEVADGRPIVVPLSGGYDSRLIALMLKRVGYENIITYTVNTGGKNSHIAQKVSNNLGLPWITADSTHEEWKSFYRSNKWDSYFDQAAYLGSLPHPTVVPSLEKLGKNGDIPDDALFIPGHSALDSMKATPVKFETQDEVVLRELTRSVISQHYKYNEHISVPEDELQDRVATTVGLNTPSAPNSSVEAFERWRLKERRAKLIVNGVRAIEFTGYDWWLPLEDAELYEFWRRVPMEHKRHRSFYENFIENLYATMCGVSHREAGANADSDLKSTISQLIQGMPIEKFIRRSYDIWDDSRVKYEYMLRKRLDEMYESDPRFGIMSKETMKENYKGQSFPFFSLLALSATDKIEFEE